MLTYIIIWFTVGIWDMDLDPEFRLHLMATKPTAIVYLPKKKVGSCVRGEASCSSKLLRSAMKWMGDWRWCPSVAKRSIISTNVNFAVHKGILDIPLDGGLESNGPLCTECSGDDRLPTLYKHTHKCRARYQPTNAIQCFKRIVGYAVLKKSIFFTYCECY